MHQDGLIHILWLGIIKYDGVRPEVFGFQDTSNSISNTNHDRGFFDILLIRCKFMKIMIPTGYLRNLVQLQRHIHRKNLPGRSTLEHTAQGSPSRGACSTNHSNDAAGTDFSLDVVNHLRNGQCSEPMAGGDRHARFGLPQQPAMPCKRGD